MNITSVIIASIIFSIISLSAYSTNSYFIDVKQNLEERENMEKIKKALLNWYDKNGSLTESLSDLQTTSLYDVYKLTDRKKENFVLLNNSSNPFSYDDSPKIYREVIVAVYSNGLDSSIDSDNLELRKSEKILLVSENDLKNTKREKTKERLGICNTASINYQNSNGGNKPNNVSDLINGNYIIGINVIDEFGENFIIDTQGKCYSKGFNKVDDNKNGDDII